MIAYLAWAVEAFMIPLKTPSPLTFFPSYRPSTPIDACNAGSQRTELHTYHDFEKGSGGAGNSERVFEIASSVSVDDRRSSCFNNLVKTHMTPAQISTVLGLDT